MSQVQTHILCRNLTVKRKKSGLGHAEGYHSEDEKHWIDFMFIKRNEAVESEGRLVTEN